MAWRAFPAPDGLTVERGLTARCEAPPLDFSAVYSTHFDDVCRWLRAMGGPEDELEDMAKEVFLVVRQRLADFDGANLRGCLYRIARNVARNYRRRQFFRLLFCRRYATSMTRPVSMRGCPDRQLDESEARRI